MKQTDLDSVANIGPWYSPGEIQESVRETVRALSSKKISPDDFRALLETYIFEDLHGDCWFLNPASSTWSRRVDDRWIPDTPRGPLASIFTNDDFFNMLSEPAGEKEIATESVTCSRCGTELPGQAKFCFKCASPVKPSEPTNKVCPACGCESKIPDAEFCIECGSALG